MQTLINFFALRPTFTFQALRAVWSIYLLHAILQAFISAFGIVQHATQRGISWEVWSPGFFTLALGLTAQVALVRVLLEVAAIVISSSRFPPT
jgi:hypothetical protein